MVAIWSTFRFTWIIGTAVAIAFKSLHKKGVKKRDMTWKVLQRTAILFGLGLLLESSDGAGDHLSKLPLLDVFATRQRTRVLQLSQHCHHKERISSAISSLLRVHRLACCLVSVDLPHLRIPGVLQRLAVSYGVVALIEVHYANDYNVNPHKDKLLTHVRDVMPYWAEWFFMLGLLAVHLTLTFMIHVPGCPK